MSVFIRMGYYIRNGTPRPWSECGEAEANEMLAVMSDRGHFLIIQSESLVFDGLTELDANDEFVHYQFTEAALRARLAEIEGDAIALALDPPARAARRGGRL